MPRGGGALAAVLSTLMIRPHRRSFIPGQTSLLIRIAANSLRSKSACQISSVTDTNGIARDVPALLTRISTLPKSKMTLSKTALILEALETSQTYSRALRPSGTKDARAACKASAPRATIATVAPDLAKARETASPMPLLPRSRAQPYLSYSCPFTRPRIFHGGPRLFNIRSRSDRKSSRSDKRLCGLRDGPLRAGTVTFSLVRS